MGKRINIQWLGTAKDGGKISLGISSLIPCKRRGMPSYRIQIHVSTICPLFFISGLSEGLYLIICLFVGEVFPVLSSIQSMMSSGESSAAGWETCCSKGRALSYCAGAAMYILVFANLTFIFHRAAQALQCDSWRGSRTIADTEACWPVWSAWNQHQVAMSSSVICWEFT